jgi:diacylglycerol kinase family enzyme
MEETIRATVQLVVNPTAGTYRSTIVAALQRAFERAGAHVIVSECRPGISFAIDPQADHVCSIGGDGTVRHVALASAACGRAIPLSIYPTGTINLIHREARCSLVPDHYAERVLRGAAARHHYAVSLNETLFLACASVGPDSTAVAALSPRLKRRIGRLAYAVAFCRTLLRWPRHEIILEADGRSISCEAFYVAKGRFFAGPWSFAPAARLHAPELHVVALSKLTRLRYLRFLLAMLVRTRIDRVPGASCFSCTELSARSDHPLPMQADGDIVAALPATLSLRPDPILFH